MRQPTYQTTSQMKGTAVPPLTLHAGAFTNLGPVYHRGTHVHIPDALPISLVTVISRFIIEDISLIGRVLTFAHNAKRLWTIFLG